MPPTKSLFRVNTLTLMEFGSGGSDGGSKYYLVEPRIIQGAYKQSLCAVYIGSEECQQGMTKVWVVYSFNLHNHQKKIQALDEKLVACLTVKQFLEISKSYCCYLEV